MSRPLVPLAITEPGVVAIARRLERESVPATVDALFAGGIRALELTLNEPEGTALAAIEAGVAHATRPGSPGAAFVIGAGTVLSIESARRARDAGATFLVSPHLDLELVRWAAEEGIPILPGGSTPTEVFAAWRAGAAAVKIFPASSLGPSFLRELRGPFPDIPLQPTGGITVEDVGDFIRAGAIAVGMGSWLYAGGDLAAVTDRASRAVDAVRQGRL